METHDLPNGQLQARTRWGTHASGAAFDRKKTSFLTEQAQEFLAQQVFCVIAGLGPYQELRGQLVMMTPGGAQAPDRQTCMLNLDESRRTSPIVQGLLHARRAGRPAQLGLFFINHAARQRLCVQGTAELVGYDRSALLRPFAPRQKLQVRLRVQQAFFHCSKYLKTRIAGLTVPVDIACDQLWQPELLLADQCLQVLTGTMRKFIAQQVLCYLCTMDRQGRCAVNHRGGAPGFLVTLPPTLATPGGIVLLPDYVGNGAFEAIGNILETKQATLVIPNYASQMALCLSGPAYTAETNELSRDLVQQCPGAERIIALSVQQVEVQHGDWSTTLAYEQARAQAILTRSLSAVACPL